LGDRKGIQLGKYWFHKTQTFCVGTPAQHGVNLENFLALCGTDGRLLEWLSITLDLDLGSGHTAYGHASLIDLYLHTNFIEIGKTFF